MTILSESLLRRLWAKIEVRGADECWPFTGYLLKGYGRIGLGRRDEGVAYAHRLVAEIAHGEGAPGAEARHLCGNAVCCNPAHLAWGDQSANESDKVAHGTSNRGARHGMAKLRPEDVIEIRARLAAGQSQKVVSGAFGITQQTVSDIARRHTWAHLTRYGMTSGPPTTT